MADGIGFLEGNPLGRTADGLFVYIDQVWWLDLIRLRDRVGGFSFTSTAAGLTILSYVDPDADRIIFWDDSEGEMASLSLGTGLSISTTTLSLDATLVDIAGQTIIAGSVLVGDASDSFAVVQSSAAGRTLWNYTDPNADRIIFWDDSETSFGSLSLGTGLSITTTTLNLAASLQSIAGITVTADALLLLADADVPRIGTANAWTGQQRINSTAPQIFFDQTDATADEGHWDLIAFGDALRCRAINDAGSTANIVWLATRTGATVDLFQVQTHIAPDANNTRDIGSAALSYRTGYFETSIELGHDSDTTLARASAGRPTCESVAIRLAGRNDIWIPASSMTAPATNGAGYLQTDESAGVSYATRDFDQTTQEFAHFHWTPPKSWNGGTVTFNPYWRPGSGVTTGNVVFALQGVAISNDDPMDATLGTEQTSDDTFIAANDMHIGPESSAITIGGTPADADWVAFRIKRNVASDNLNGDARLVGILLHITTNASEDT